LLAKHEGNHQMETTIQAGGAYKAVSLALFMSLFAGQAALIAMSPVLTQAAADLDVSIAAAGQLRTLTGLTAGFTALLMGRLLRNHCLGRQIIAAALLLALGSLASACAPSFAVLALAQVPVGIAIAVLTTAGTLAAAEWVSPELRTKTLSWALVGQPAAWIVGMPLIGLVGEHSWRYSWVVLPFVAALAAAALAAPRRQGRSAPALPAARSRAVLGDSHLARWLLSELLVNSAWAGTLVYSGALYSESYGISSGETGLLLALSAVAYVAGNLSSRRLTRYEACNVLIVIAVVLALTGAVFGMVRTDPLLSTALLSVAAFAAGARALVASTFALSAAPALRPAVLRLRASTMQFGYFVGSIAGGLALAVGGFRTLGATMGIGFVGAAAAIAPPVTRRPRTRRPRLALA
jgi:DHA1 family inner membrane transport protein